MLRLLLSGKVFAVGSAIAKTLFNHLRAIWGVKGRSFAASAKPISPLDTPNRANTQSKNSFKASKAPH
jgi:hypothetical protein